MPNYVTQTTVSMGVGGPMHKPTFFRSGGTSAHPLQRQGVVPFTPGANMPNLGAPVSADIQGRAPAAWDVIPTPQPVPLFGSLGNGRFQV
jgi:hypothetical protein